MEVPREFAICKYNAMVIMMVMVFRDEKVFVAMGLAIERAAVIMIAVLTK